MIQALNSLFSTVVQGATDATGVDDGFITAGGILTALLVLILILIQHFTERNIWNFLARIDGIGLIAIGTAGTVLVTVSNADFGALRVYGAFVAGGLVLLVAWRSDAVDTVPEYVWWFSIGGALRMILVGSMVTTLITLLTRGPSGIGPISYLSGFPVAGIAMLITVATTRISDLTNPFTDD
ncbi:hypothetical protein SG26_14360 [Haloarcula sp. CBA1115]|uniref:hypothetical protein n=1 Tax=unclassified Haloarcula TaxID=2624677 RepID=UPI0005955595|nr:MULTISPECIES: hypothetical protein [unclassified Haloarcula]AJF26824.1 hypothetical protein SG26_14360 [Haloarcula sp. CBA1115]